jgi:hypothetical protein
MTGGFSRKIDRTPNKAKMIEKIRVGNSILTV